MGLSLPGAVRFVRRWWLVLVIVPLVTGALAVAFGATRTPMYASSATLLVSIPQSSSLDGYNANLLAQDLAVTYQTLVRTDPVLQPVAAAANPPLTTNELRANTAVGGSSGALFSVTVVDADPARAAALTRAITDQFISFVSTLYGSADGESGDHGSVTTVVAGAIPESPYAPRLPAYLALGIIAGLVLVNVGLMLFERLDTRIRAVKDLAGSSPLAWIPSAGKHHDGPEALILDDPRAVATGEGIRALRTAVMAAHATPGSILAIASPGRGEGKTFVAANLATAIANAGKLVVLVDANLREPRLHDIFQLDNVHGLGTLLAVPGLSWKTSAIRVAPNLAVIPAGPVRDHPADLLAKPALAALLEEVAAAADIVIIDTPAMAVANDAVEVAMPAHAVLLVGRVGATRRETLESTAGTFLEMGVDVLGLTVNDGSSRRRFRRWPRLSGWRFWRRQEATALPPADSSATGSA